MSTYPPPRWLTRQRTASLARWRYSRGGRRSGRPTQPQLTFAALNGLERYDEAIPYLERRLSEYGDNSSGEVKKALDEARRKA